MEVEVEGVDVDCTEHIENDEEEQLPVGLAENFQVQAGRTVKKKRKLESTDEDEECPPQISRVPSVVSNRLFFGRVCTPAPAQSSSTSSSSSSCSSSSASSSSIQTN